MSGHSINSGTASNDELLKSIYAATLQTALWNEVLESIAQALGGASALFACADLKTLDLSFVSVTGAPRELISLLIDRYLPNPWVKAYMSFPDEVARPTESLVPLRELARTQFYSDIVEPGGVHHGIVFGRNAPGAFVAFSVHRSLSKGEFHAQDCARLEALRPALLMAADTRLRFQNLDLQRSAAFDALEFVPSAMVLADSRGHVFFANARARKLLSECDGLTMRRGELVAATSDLTSELRARLATAVKKGIGRGLKPGGELTLPRPSGAPGLSVSIIPLVTHQLTLAGRKAAAAVFIADPDSNAPPRIAMFKNLFKLTEAEVRVVQLVVTGKGLPNVARKLGVSVNTVRTHLYRVMDKTGTRRQSELAALVYTLQAHQPSYGMPDPPALATRADLPPNPAAPCRATTASRNSQARG